MIWFYVVVIYIYNSFGWFWFSILVFDGKLSLYKSWPDVLVRVGF